MEFQINTLVHFMTLKFNELFGYHSPFFKGGALRYLWLSLEIPIAKLSSLHFHNLVPKDLFTDSHQWRLAESLCNDDTVVSNV